MKREAFADGDLFGRDVAPIGDHLHPCGLRLGESGGVGWVDIRGQSDARGIGALLRGGDGPVVLLTGVVIG